MGKTYKKNHCNNDKYNDDWTDKQKKVAKQNQIKKDRKNKRYNLEDL